MSEDIDKKKESRIGDMTFLCETMLDLREKVAKLEKATEFVIGDIKEIRLYLNDLTHETKDIHKLLDSRITALETHRAKFGMIEKVFYVIVTSGVSVLVAYLLGLFGFI